MILCELNCYVTIGKRVERKVGMLQKCKCSKSWYQVGVGSLHIKSCPVHSFVFVYSLLRD